MCTCMHKCVLYLCYLCFLLLCPFCEVCSSFLNRLSCPGKINCNYLKSAKCYMTFKPSTTLTLKKTSVDFCNVQVTWLGDKKRFLINKALHAESIYITSSALVLKIKWYHLLQNCSRYIMAEALYISQYTNAIKCLTVVKVCRIKPYRQ